MKRVAVRLVGAAAAVTAGVAVSQSAVAGTLELGATGWTASWTQPGIQLSLDPTSSVGGISVEKLANFTSLAPAAITFTPSATASASLRLNIDSEFVFNNTSQTWSGFEYQLLSTTSSGGTPSATFNSAASAIGSAGGFSIGPFTRATYNADRTVLALTGGSVSNSGPTANQFQPGLISGQLVINGSGGSPFTLKEIPVPTGIPTTPGGVPTPQPPAAIPLPPAAWSGLVTLAGLGAVGGWRRVRRKLA